MIVGNIELVGNNELTHQSPLISKFYFVHLQNQYPDPTETEESMAVGKLGLFHDS
jgi:hypothetical protein